VRMWLGAHVAVSLRDTGAKGKDGAGEACHCPLSLRAIGSILQRKMSPGKA